MGDGRKSCGDCLYVEFCEADPILSAFDRNNTAYCKAFKNAADVVEVVRCSECRHGREINKNKSPERYFRSDCVVCQCENVVGDEIMVYKPNHFCSYGEKREA